MTSLSTPFSFETASTTIKISLFIYSSPRSRRARNCRAPAAPASVRRWRQARLGNLPERHLYLFFINFQRNPVFPHRLQRARVAAAAGARGAQLDKHPLAREAREM